MNADEIRQELTAEARRYLPTHPDQWAAIRRRLPAGQAPPPARVGVRRLTHALALVALLALVTGTVVLLPDGLRPWASSATATPSAQPVVGGTVVPVEPTGASGILYGFGSPDPARPGGFSALDLATEALRGWVPPRGGQGMAWALAPDGRRAYLLDSDPATQHAVWELTELEAPSLRVLRRIPVPNAIRLLGTGYMLAVAPDGRQVYVRTLESRSRPGEYARSGDDAVAGIAVFDAANLALVRVIRLGSGSCGSLDALPDGVLLLSCTGSVHWVDPQRGEIVATLPMNYGDLVVGPDGRRAWHVERLGTLSEIDVTTRRVSRRIALTRTPGAHGALPVTPAAPIPPGSPDAELRVPNHLPRVTADGARLFILGSPVDKVGGFGQSTVAWVVDTRSLTVEAEVALPAPAADLAPPADGRLLLVASGEAGGEAGAVRLIEVATGREVRRWAGPVGMLLVR